MSLCGTFRSFRLFAPGEAQSCARRTCPARRDNVEDRRGMRVPGGRGGLGIGTVVILGLLGWWLGIDPSDPDRRGRHPHRRGQLAAADAAAGGPHRRRRHRPDRPVRRGRARRARRRSGRRFSRRMGRPTSRRPWSCSRAPPARPAASHRPAMGPFYCPNDQQGLSRHLVLRGLERRFAPATPAARRASSRRPT